MLRLTTILLVLLAASCRQSKVRCEKVCVKQVSMEFSELGKELFNGDYDIKMIKDWEPWGTSARKADDMSWTKIKMLRYIVSHPAVKEKLHGNGALSEEQVVTKALKDWLSSEDIAGRQLPLCIEACHKQGRKEEVDCLLEASDLPAMRQCTQ